MECVTLRSGECVFFWSMWPTISYSKFLKKSKIAWPAKNCMASYIEVDEDTSQPFRLFAHVLTMVCPCAVDRFKPPVFIRRLPLYWGLRSFWLYTHHVSTKDKSVKLIYSLWSPHEHDKGINFGACINFSYPTHDPRKKSVLAFI